MKNEYSILSFMRWVLTILLLCAAQSVFAQTTVITHPGKLEIGGLPANGDFDFQFKLFDAATNGLQQGATLEQLNITVINGAYTVSLDFGAAVFTGADRFLEINYRPVGGTYTTLTPRQLVTSAPYSIRSQVATTAEGLTTSCTNCVTSSQIQSVQGSQVSGSISGSQISGTIPVASLPTGSSKYIQNTVVQQPGSNFNISGSGTVAGTLSAGILYGNVVNTTTQYNINGTRVLSHPGNNVFVGIGSGGSNTTGSANSFFGYAAGLQNTTGGNNSFFGSEAGSFNTTGGDNAFFGDDAGAFNTTGHYNSFFGRNAGAFNKTGLGNVFIGYGADFATTNPSGSNNTLLGYNTKVNSGVSNSTAIGASAQVSASNTIVLGTSSETVIVRGKLQVDTLGTAGSQQVCLNGSNRLAPCSSSLRYKTDLQPFAGGLSIINRLEPISYTWKDGGLRDVGFGAEAVERVEPLFITYKANGQVEGVKYDRITVALVNAIKEQQQQIVVQQRQITELSPLQAENAKLKAQLADILTRLEELEKLQAGQK